VPTPGMQPPQPPPPPPQKSGMSTGLIVVLVVFPVLIVVIGMLAVLAIYGVRKYIANAKTAEARNALGQIGKDAVAAYEADEPHRICPSASSPVPKNQSYVSGLKYMAAEGEWEADRATNAGFHCLKFSMMSPQYYQYRYTATPASFEAVAHGDLNGDGKFSTFSLSGKTVGAQLVVSPSILEVSPEE
jgi:type IV pilus assembly protein PilA